MREENKGSILLVDDKASIAKFISINLKHSGYDVSVVSGVRMAEEVAPLLIFDLVAVSSTILVNSGDAVPRLRRSLSCPVLVYSHEIQTQEEVRTLNADYWVSRFYEPGILLQSVAEMLEKEP